MSDGVAAGTDIVDAGLTATQAAARALAPDRGPRPLAMIASRVLGGPAFAGPGFDTPGLDGEAAPLDEVLQRCADHPERVISSPELREGVASSVERRPPRFAPLGPSPDRHADHHRR